MCLVPSRCGQTPAAAASLTSAPDTFFSFQYVAFIHNIFLLFIATDHFIFSASFMSLLWWKVTDNIYSTTDLQFSFLLLIINYLLITTCLHMTCKVQTDGDSSVL